MDNVLTFEQDTQHQEQQQQQNQNQQQQPNTSQQIPFPQSSTSKDEPFSSAVGQQNSYRVKCNLLEYHIQEAILINKALRSELKQYKDKIDFEKKLRKFLVNRVKGVDP